MGRGHTLLSIIQLWKKVMTTKATKTQSKAQAEQSSVTVSTQVDNPAPTGRPSKYDPLYCKLVRELGKKGKSFEQMALSMDVSYRTLCRWRDEHEEFCHALEDAQAYSQAWWEDQAQSYMVEVHQGEKLNPSLWSRSMAARFPNKYSDRNRVEVTGKDGEKLQMEIDHVNLALEDFLKTLEKKL